MIAFWITILIQALHTLCASSPWENHVAASTSDLKKLFELEVAMIADLQNWQHQVKRGQIREGKNELSKDLKLVEEAFERLKISEWHLDDPMVYVQHPVNAFNLLKRTTSFWPRIFENTSSMALEEEVESKLSMFPDLDDFHYGGCVGLINIELHYGRGSDDGNANSIWDLAQGKVTDPDTKSTFIAKHGLTSEDCLQISEAAKRIWRVDKHVLWIQGAIEVAEKLEGKNPMELRKLKRLLNQAEEYHDDLLLKFGINSIQKEIGPHSLPPDGQPSSPLFTNLRPFDEELEEVPSYLKARKKYKKELNISQPFVDIRPLDVKDGRYMDKSWIRMRTSMAKMSSRLCNGDDSVRSIEKDKGLFCHLLHYQNPYLRLSPFKYEPLNMDPHVGLVRDFFSDIELDSIVQDSQDKLHSTVFYVDNSPRYYTSQRSSKRRHLENEDHNLAIEASKRLSLATRWNLLKYTSSEHYHVINYGIGGQIEVHVDYWGPNFTMDRHPGGARTATAIGYASTTLVGGYTIFPGLGLYIKPQRGDLLFWLTVKNDLEYDSRMFHMGCPVVYGNKWILTKWLYSNDQWIHHKSDKNQGENFPPFSNSQTFSNDFTLDVDEYE